MARIKTTKMTKQEIIDRIQLETLDYINKPREEEIEKYIELWEKYKEKVE